MAQQAKISYSVLVQNIPKECANILDNIVDLPDEGIDDLVDTLRAVGAENKDFDLRESLFKLERVRNALALVDQRVMEVGQILAGLQDALFPTEAEEEVDEDDPRVQGPDVAELQRRAAEVQAED